MVSFGELLVSYWRVLVARNATEGVPYRAQARPLTDRSQFPGKTGPKSGETWKDSGKFSSCDCLQTRAAKRTAIASFA
jgi:hypothetical protein